MPVKALWVGDGEVYGSKCPISRRNFVPQGFGVFAPPDNEMAASVFRTLISIAAEPNWDEIKSGRALLPILNRITQLRDCTNGIRPHAS